MFIKAVYGDKEKKVEISKPFGAGEQYHIYIDNYFCGTLMKRNGKWIIPDHPEYTSDDIMVLGDLAEQIIS